MDDFKFSLGDAASSLLPNAIYTLKGTEYSVGVATKEMAEVSKIMRPNLWDDAYLKKYQFLKTYY